jgi:hypothetical protein
MVRIQLNPKIKASTLLEVIISMVVIMVVFGIAMMIFSKITTFSISGKASRARAALEYQLTKIEKAKIFTNESLVAGDFNIDQTAMPYRSFDNLLLLTLTAYDTNNKVVAQLRRIEIKQ